MRACLVRDNQTVSTAITILQLTAPSTMDLTLVRAWCEQGGSTTSAAATIELIRKTATATLTNTLTPVALSENDPAPSATAKSVATAEGTDGNILIREAFNVLNGWLYLPVPEERIVVKAGGILALKFPSAPASQSWEFGFVWLEG